MWILAAIFSSIFAGVTAILSKIGLKDINSDYATAIRTTVVLVLAWCIVYITGAQQYIDNINYKSWIYLILSGIATGASWICYFKALSLGEVSKVAVVDKSSIVLTVLFALIFFKEERNFWWAKLICLFFITLGTFFMSDIKHGESKSKIAWFIFAFLSALFASFTTLLAKIGIENVDSNLATAIRTCVVFVMAWTIVLFRKNKISCLKINGKEIIFLILSGVATCASWLCYYYAIQQGQVSIVVPIDKLSILITVLFSLIVFKEKLSLKAWFGLFFLIGGTICMTLFS